MQRIPLIRLLTYFVFIAILFLRPTGIHVIPVHTISEDDEWAAEVQKDRLRADQPIVDSVGFTDATRSGAELLRLALAAARPHIQRLPEYQLYQVKLHATDGRLQWVLNFANRQIAQSQFVVTIDDRTSTATFKEAIAEM